MEPVFSIIIPLFNRENTILAALESIQTQTFAEFECLIIDDKSSDSSVALVNEFIKSDKRFVLLKHDINKGAAAARNTGLSKAKGSFISFLDSDDFFETDFLNSAYKTLSSTDASIGFMWTGYRLLCYKNGNKHTEEKVWVPSVTENSYITFLNNLQIGIGAGITLKREVLDVCGRFDEELPAAEDTEFFWRISQKFDYTFSEKILINIRREGEDRLSKRFDKIYEAYQKIIPQHLSTIKKYKHLRIKYFYKMQWLSYCGGDKSSARSYFSYIMKDDFFNIKSWLILISFEFLGMKLASRLHKSSRK